MVGRESSLVGVCLGVGGGYRRRGKGNHWFHVGLKEPLQKDIEVSPLAMGESLVRLEIKRFLLLYKRDIERNSSEKPPPLKGNPSQDKISLPNP